jgi:hypothetical protein
MSVVSYQCLIRLILMFTTLVWQPTTKENILKLQKIQNRTSRFIFGKTHTQELTIIFCMLKTFTILLMFGIFFQCRSDLIDSRVIDVVRIGRPIRDEIITSRFLPSKAVNIG